MIHLSIISEIVQRDIAKSKTFSDSVLKEWLHALIGRVFVSEAIYLM